MPVLLPSLAMLGAVLLWGSSPTVNKWVLADVGVSEIVAFRIVGAGLVLWLLLAALRRVRWTGPLPLLMGKHKLNIPNQTMLDGWVIAADIVSSKEVDALPDAQEYTAYLSYHKVGDELFVRSRIPGDRFQPLGMGQSKKLQDFMVDARIPRSWRDRVPLVVSPKGVAWVMGWRMADWARAEDRDSAILRLDFTPRL